MERIGEDQVDTSHDPFPDDQDNDALHLGQDVVGDRDSSSLLNNRDNNSFHSRHQHNITASNNISFSDEDITFPQHNTESHEEQLQGDEDAEEEEDTVTQPAGVGDNWSGGIAGSRKARTRWWPPQSDAHRVYPSLQQRKDEVGGEIITLGRGQNSGRNRLAIFQDTDTIPRLAFNIRVQGRTQWKGYLLPKDYVLPVGISLSEILAHYPNHVWNDGLRLFMAEGWQAEGMWQATPIDARNNGARDREWNYLQQALGREADKIGEEEFGQKRVPDKRPKKDEPDSDKDGDDDGGDSSGEAVVNLAAVYTNTPVGGLQTLPRNFPTNNQHRMTSYAPGFRFNQPAQDLSRSQGQGQAGSDGNSATTRRRGPASLAYPEVAN